MAKYKAYPEYKDSGIEWLGEIPAHWNILLGKKLFHSVRINAFKSDEQLAASQKYGVIPQSLMMQLNDSKVMLALKGTDSFRHVEKNNFVISLRSFEGGIEYSKYSGCVSPAYTVLKNAKPITFIYYQYLFKCAPFIAALQASTDSLRDGKAINYEQFGAIYLPFASIIEQKIAANFLIHETKKFDNLIEKQQQLIELLKEKRQALISHVVAKGLNPDVPMKDSGVEWLDKVPSHWQKTSIKHTTKLNPVKKALEFSLYQKCSFIPMEKLKLGRITLDEIKVVKEVYHAYTYFENDDILIAKVTPCFENKNFAIAKNLVNGLGFGSTEIYVLRCNNSISNEFIFYRLQESNFLTIAERAMTGAGGLKRVPSEVVSSFKYFLPSLIEQKEIVSFLNSETKKIDTLIQKQLQQIELLKERRTALISAAVTGKIDLRDWTPPASSSEESSTAEEAIA